MRRAKYNSLINNLSPSYSKVVFVNLSVGAIGVMGSSCNSLSSLLHDSHFDTIFQEQIIMKAIKISVALNSCPLSLKQAHGLTQNF